MRVRYFLLILSLCFITERIKAQPPGYSFGKQLLIQSSQVPGGTPINDFVMLVALTDNDLRSVPNGGNVESSSGYDIIFTLGDCSTVLDHQIEKYDPATGTYIAWVRLPQLNSTSNTNVHMYYGNGSVSSDPSTPSTWGTDYYGVWHLHNNLLDATSTSYDGTNNGSMNAPNGKIASGRNFDDPNDFIDINSFPQISSAFTISGWVRTEDPSEQGQRIFCDDENNDPEGYALSVGDPGTERLRFYIRSLNPVSLDSPNNTILSNTWHHCVAVFDPSVSEKRLYVDGSLVASDGYAGSFVSSQGNASIGGELPGGETNNRFEGDLDEIRVAKDPLASERIEAQYNNQNAPASFYNKSSEMSASDLCAALPIQLLQFEGDRKGPRSVMLRWKVASESRVRHYEVLRSQKGDRWKTVDTVHSNGTTVHGVSYRLKDRNAPRVQCYYKLLHHEMNGTEKSHKLITVPSFDGESTLRWQSLSKDIVLIRGKDLKPGELKLFDAIGKEMSPEQVPRTSRGKGTIMLNFADVPSGIYFLLAKGEVLKLAM